jgi:hypothetical protein
LTSSVCGSSATRNFFVGGWPKKSRRPATSSSATTDAGGISIVPGFFGATIASNENRVYFTPPTRTSSRAYGSCRSRLPAVNASAWRGFVAGGAAIVNASSIPSSGTENS